jgi:hypothetical protein
MKIDPNAFVIGVVIYCASCGGLIEAGHHKEDHLFEPSDWFVSPAVERAHQPHVPEQVFDTTAVVVVPNLAASSGITVTPDPVRIVVSFPTPTVSVS